jgi:hypothetical protein
MSHPYYSDSYLQMINAGVFGNKKREELLPEILTRLPKNDISFLDPAAIYSSVKEHGINYDYTKLSSEDIISYATDKTRYADPNLISFPDEVPFFSSGSGMSTTTLLLIVGAIGLIAVLSKK